MNIHYIQHETFEDPGCIREWLYDSGHHITYTHIFEKGAFPDVNQIDLLIIMGGSMGANDDEKFTWMPVEKALIRDCIRLNKKILGICLGSQLIAHVLGAKVYAAHKKEIGWFPVSMTRHVGESAVFKHFPEYFITMHWHGDTYDLPPGSLPIASSECTPYQAFIYNRNVIGLQFHPELTPLTIEALIDETGELVKDTYVQAIDEIKAGYHHTTQNNKLIFTLLDKLAEL